MIFVLSTQLYIEPDFSLVISSYDPCMLITFALVRVNSIARHICLIYKTRSGRLHVVLIVIK